MNDLNSIGKKSSDSIYQTLQPALSSKTENEKVSEVKNAPAPQELRMEDDAQFMESVRAFKNQFEKLPAKEQFSIASVLSSLIEYGKIMQGLAIVYAATLSNSTKQMVAINEKLKEIPVISVKDLRKPKADGKPSTDKELEAEDAKNKDAAATLQATFANAMEALRAEKGLEEDFAKKIQVMMQSIKESGTAASDFISTWLDLLRGISAKITQ